MKKENSGDKMINIGIVRFNNGIYGGIETQITNIISNLQSKSYNFILITNNKTKFSESIKKYVKVYYIDSKNILRATKQLSNIVKENSINILQSHMLREHYICCLVKALNKNLRHIFRVHTYINCSFIREYKKKLYHILSFLLSKFVDIYLPINNKNKYELIDYTKINSKKIKVVHNGVNKLNCEILKDNFNYYDIAMIANFDYGKGHDIAIKALKILVDNNPKYNITFIGHEKNKTDEGVSITESVKQLAKKLGVDKNIKFLGFVENIGDAIKDIDIVILPSYSEGTPNCLLEAMSVKKIAIASSVGGIPEFIFDNKSGFLHENKDYETLAIKILQLPKLENKKLNLIKEKGYETWKDNFSVESLCNNLKKIYKELV